MNTLINFIGSRSNAELAALTLALGAAFVAVVFGGFLVLAALTGAGRASDEAEDDTALERKYGPLK